MLCSLAKESIEKNKYVLGRAFKIALNNDDCNCRLVECSVTHVRFTNYMIISVNSTVYIIIISGLFFIPSVVEILFYFYSTLCILSYLYIYIFLALCRCL